MKILRMALLVLVPAITMAQQPLPGSIQGVVVRQGTNDLLSNATVELRPSAGAGAAVDSTVSDADGKFFFPKVPPGTYRVAAIRSGYVRAEYGQRKTGSPALSIAIETGQKTPDIRLEMTPGGVISGRVTDSGQPVGMAHVYALKSTYHDGLRTMTPVLSARTDDRGEYSIFWLPPGKYYVAAVVFDIGAIGNLALVYLNPDGESGGAVTARATSRAVLNREIGSGAGDDRMHVPMYFPSTPEWQRAIPIAVEPGAEIRTVNIDASPVPVWGVRGTVTGLTASNDAAGRPVRPEMFMSRVDLPFPLINQPSSISVEIGPSGSFEVSRVVPGPYRLIAAQGGPTGGNGGNVFVEVRDRDLNGVNLEMIPRLSISGRIVMEAPVQAGGSPPFASFVVTLRQDYNSSLRRFSATPGSDGSFEFGPIQSGILLRVSVGPILRPPTDPGATPPVIPQQFRNTYVKSIRLGETDVLNDGLHLLGQPRDELVVVLGTNPGTLEGRVVDVRQQPVAAATVVLIPDGGIRFRVDHKFTSTDASGRFQMQSIPPGDYKVFAWEEVERGDWQDPDFVRDYESLGKPVRIEEGGKHVNFEVAVIPPKP